MKFDSDTFSGMLSDRDIREFWNNGIYFFTTETGDLEFDIDKQLQLGSIDLRFRHECKRIKLQKDDILNYEMLKNHSYTELFELNNSEKLKIKPGEIIFTTTLETVQLSEQFAGIITGRSSIARLGIMVHCCQEYINPGHMQPLPLQIINLGPNVVELDLSVPVCQLILFKLRTPSTGKYKDKKGAKYANEVGPVNSQIHKEISNNTSTYYENNNNRFYKLKSIICKYLMPFLPTLIMMCIITPLYNNILNGKSIIDIISAVKYMPFSWILGMIFGLLFWWIKRGD